MSDALVSIYRAYVPGDFAPVRVPMICICTASDWECELEGGADIADAMSSSIWFLDREGWRIAWRVVRKIRAGRSVIRTDLPPDIRIRAEFSPIHFWEAA